MFIDCYGNQDSEVNSMNGSHTISHHNSVKNGCSWLSDTVSGTVMRPFSKELLRAMKSGSVTTIRLISAFGLSPVPAQNWLNPRPTNLRSCSVYFGPTKDRFTMNFWKRVRQSTQTSTSLNFSGWWLSLSKTHLNFWKRGLPSSFTTTPAPTRPKKQSPS